MMCDSFSNIANLLLPTQLSDCHNWVLQKIYNFEDDILKFYGFLEYRTINC